jgi:CRP-like cAMP-binding protein
MTAMVHPRSNLLLDRLPQAYGTSLRKRMEEVSLSTKTVFFQTAKRPKYAHFLTSGIAFIMTVMADGSRAEVGWIGREGVVEGLHLLGPARMPTSAFLQFEGTALRILFTELEKEFLHSEHLHSYILESVQCHNLVLNQIAACHRLHAVEGRLARWLLMVEDRTRSNSFVITQEFLAQMLGTRRTAVTLTAGRLQRAGLIEYRRAHIRILDRPKLERLACECYPIARDLIANLHAPSKLRKGN